MRIHYVVHILAGSVALVAGYVALSATKGAVVHRRSGLVFVAAMLVMASIGGVIAALSGGDGTVIAAVMTCYLVVTAFTTVRGRGAWSHRADVGLMALALAVGITSVTLGFVTAASPTGMRGGLPPFPFFMFGIVGLIGGVGDARMIRAGGVLRGAPRLARHLWRMCWGLWIAASSFFLGQADTFPQSLRHPALLAIPVLIPVLAMLYWLWRVRAKKTARVLGIVEAS